MNAKRHEPSFKRDPQANDQPTEPEIGGREFGQVIDPMQAQMASENEGLTEKPATKEGHSKQEKKGRKAA